MDEVVYPVDQIFVDAKEPSPIIISRLSIPQLSSTKF
jgi:hypothetical protein